MKELSIEEKAQRYDEAIKVAKRNYDTIIQMDEDCTFGKSGIVNTFHHMFPELKEDEDERIREAILWCIRTVELELGCKDAKGVAVDELKSWVEKRAEQKQDVNMQINPSEYINDMGGNGCYMKNTTQNSTNEVEPKFKVGDWVVCEAAPRSTAFKIGDVAHISNKEALQIFLMFEDCFRHWTIQDAKDGDVLANKYGSVFIYAGFENDKRVTVDDYCYVTANHDEFCVETHETGSWYYVDDLNPSTKEQRYLLFKKMKEAGYEWDSDKKELRQIDQKTADKVEHKFKVGDWVTDGVAKYQIRFIDDTQYWYSENCILGSIESIDKKYHLWTIQDAKDGDVLYLQKDGKEHIIIYKGVIKERFRTFVSAYCAYNGIVDAFCFADVSRYLDIAYGGIMPATKEQRELLFSKMHEAGYKWNAEELKLEKIEQTKWWSEEDEKIYSRIYDIIHTSACANYDVDEDGKELGEYAKITNWFKSIKDRCALKPSDDQIKALEIAIRCGIQLGTWEECALKSLKEDLKKLI